MKIMLVTARGARTRRYDLRQPGEIAGLALFVGPWLLAILVATFVAGVFAQRLWLSHSASLLRPALEQSQSQLEAVRELRQQEQEAFTRQLGELQARLLRLDALGDRLVQLGALDPEEFDFRQRPSQGGPAIEWLAAPSESMGLGGEIGSALEEAEAQELKLNALSDLLQTRRIVEAATPDGLPVTRGWISSFFGRRNDPFTGRRAHHRGVDFAGREGSPIIAVASGVVVYSGPRYGYGNLVEINHGGGLVTRYGHNKENLVAVGSTVARGQQIALMGSTGRATGPHLHFEVHRDGRAVDPLSFISDKQPSTD